MIRVGVVLPWARYYSRPTMPGAAVAAGCGDAGIK
jgi:hypothetical protein